VLLFDTIGSTQYEKDFRKYLNSVHSDNTIIFNYEFNQTRLEKICRENKSDVYIITPHEGHQYFHVVYDFVTKLPKDFNLNLYYIGNFFDDTSFKINSNTIYLKPMKNSPFSTFSFHPLFILSNHDIVEKKHLFSCFMFGKTLVRDYIWTQLNEYKLSGLISYHSFDKTKYNKTKLINSYDELSKHLDNNLEDIFDKKFFKNYTKHKSKLPKRLDIEESALIFHRYFDDSVKTASKSLFNLVSETTFGWNIFESGRKYPKGSLTEKSMIPFFSNSIPLILHDDNNLVKKHFEENGFDMFSDIIPDDFYKLEFFNQKVDFIFEFLSNYNNDINKFYNKSISRFEHNRKLAYKLKKSITDIERIL